MPPPLFAENLRHRERDGDQRGGRGCERHLGAGPRPLAGPNDRYLLHIAHPRSHLGMGPLEEPTIQVSSYFCHRFAAAELPVLVGELAPGVDMVAGRRRPVVTSAWPWHARLGNLVIAALLRRRHGLPVHDIAAMRVTRRAQLLALGPLHPRSGYPLQL